jgi:hypothetical protein
MWAMAMLTSASILGLKAAAENRLSKYSLFQMHKSLMTTTLSTQKKKH